MGTWAERLWKSGVWGLKGTGGAGGHWVSGIWWLKGTLAWRLRWGGAGGPQGTGGGWGG